MKSVLFDLNNLAIRCLFNKEVIFPSNSEEYDSIDYDYWKYLVFNSIYSSIKQVNNISEIVLGIDSSPSWRKLYYSRYKEQRKKQRDKQNINWDEFFTEYHTFCNVIKKHLPIKVLKLTYCEADDIIGHICLTNNKQNHIISTDKDYLQLCNKNVTIYNPMKQENISHPDPEFFIKEQSMIGQAKDNVFNIKTPLDWPCEVRKPGFGVKAFEKVMINGFDKFLEDGCSYTKKFTRDGKDVIYKSEINYKERYEFNRTLLDFKRIPKKIGTLIEKEYNNYCYPSPDNIWIFFEKMNWPEYLKNYINVETKLLQLF